MAGIQFFGKKSVIEAYNLQGIDCWAVFEGKDLNDAGCDEERLEKFLTQLEPDGSTATYMLKLYRNCEDPDEITPKTEYSRCFKFKLNQRAGEVGGAITRYGGTDPITAKIQGVIMGEVGAALDKRLGRGGDDQPPESFQDAIIGLVKQPDKLMGVLNGLRGLFAPPDMLGQTAVPYGGVTGTFAPPRRTGAPTPPASPTVSAPEAAPPKPVAQDGEAMTDADLDRLGAALDRLGKVDKDIVSHIEKLADLAEKKPDTYKMGITMLS